MKEKDFSEIIASLQAGNAQYMQYKYDSRNLNPENREALNKDQHPEES